jgi:Fe-S oxidoreductase
MATREEQHSTRGRSRLLFEMLEGNPLSNGWRSEPVKEALDLCLACKACQGECPVNVDMATYKAEFLSHYYQGRRRPLSAYAFGLMHRWARLASHAPWLANVATQAPLLRAASKRIVNIAPERRIPRFAPRTFRRWFATHRSPNPNGPPVVLWPDTWNEYFLPNTAQAAVTVLERAGFRVTIPGAVLCCGRPLYDFGMLDRARSLLRRVVDALRPQLRAGTRVVGLEPSCVSVFRDELVEMLPNDDDAKRLRDQTVTLAELLASRTPAFATPPLRRKAIVHGHCHDKSILGFDAHRTVLDAASLDYHVLDSGCCGMAGAFGYEKGEHYRVSIACGERVLLPAVRDAADDTLIVADGFSCREQIEQTTHRKALHLAEVLAMAFDQPREGT